MGVTRPGGIYILLKDQSNLYVKSDLPTRFSKDLVSDPVDLGIVSRNTEHSGQGSFGSVAWFSDPQGIVAPCLV